MCIYTNPAAHCFHIQCLTVVQIRDDHPLIFETSTGQTEQNHLQNQFFDADYNQVSEDSSSSDSSSQDSSEQEANQVDPELKCSFATMSADIRQLLLYDKQEFILRLSQKYVEQLKKEDLNLIELNYSVHESLNTLVDLIEMIQNEEVQVKQEQQQESEQISE